ncbi:hypothetical protein R6Q57_015248 [Mikania cordata]
MIYGPFLIISIQQQVLDSLGLNVVLVFSADYSCLNPRLPMYSTFDFVVMINSVFCGVRKPEEFSRKMDVECLNSDIISTLPQNTIETILTHMPIRDALRTSILSKKWRIIYEIPSISDAIIKYLSAGGMPHELPTSLVHLKNLFLSVCMTEQNEISSALCLIRSSPFLMKINIKHMINDKKERLPVGETPTNFLDPENHSDLKLAHLEILEIEMFRNFPFEMEFVKLIMAKSPMLKKVQIQLNVSVEEEVMMLRDLVLLPFPRASPSAKLIIKR